MKKIITSLLCLSMFLCVSNAQRILYVDNTPSAPTGTHVYSNLQTAVDASQPGDIIHVKPSSTSYGNIEITNANDSISIFGIGINPDKELAEFSRISTLYLSGYNIRIAGFYISSSVILAYRNASGNISFENNWMDGTVYVPWTSHAISNVLFRNNFFRGFVQMNATSTNTTVFNNCIFSYNSTTTGGQINSQNGTLFSHCLFFGVGGGATRHTFSDCSNTTISNSIFLGRSPNPSGSMSNTTFNNCYAAESHNNVFPSGGGNSVNGIITSISGTVFADPEIILQQSWNSRWDPALDPASLELVNGGDNSTDVGLTGGTIPYKVTGTPLPYIKSMVVPAVIKKGDNLNVTIQATSN